jgi:MYXO-CTERM domain-containing protein
MTDFSQKRARLLPKAAGFIALTAGLAPGASHAAQLGDIFYIDMENHNLTQPATDTRAPGALFGNPAATFLNSLMTAGNANAAQTSWASNYYNVLAGTGQQIHPSEPNYIWQEAGTNFGVLNDNLPYGTGGTNQNTTNHLTGLMQTQGITWKAYQEDIDQAKNATGGLTNTVLPQNQWTVPLNNIKGTSADYTNAYNGSHQYDFAPKHDGTLFFTDTNGGNDTSSANPLVSHYAPLQQLQNDLAHNNVSRYNLISPDQFNDMHTALTGGFDYKGVHYTGDQAAIAQGDNFLSKIVPMIQASDAYKNNGAIVIWFDETEGANADDLNHTLAEIVISPLAKGNAYMSTFTYTHSSDLKTMQEIFNLQAQGGDFLGDANSPGTFDLSDMFIDGVIPHGFDVPEPPQTATMSLGLLGLFGLAFRARRRARA